MQLSELAATLRNVCSVVPAGVVCFFGSYDYMDLVYGHMEESGVLASIQSKKTVFKEPRSGNQVDKMLQQYGQATRNPVNGECSICIFIVPSVFVLPLHPIRLLLKLFSHIVGY